MPPGDSIALKLPSSSRSMAWPVGGSRGTSYGYNCTWSRPQLLMSALMLVFLRRGWIHDWGGFCGLSTCVAAPLIFTQPLFEASSHTTNESSSLFRQSYAIVFSTQTCHSLMFDGGNVQLAVKMNTKPVFESLFSHHLPNGWLFRIEFAATTQHSKFMLARHKKNNKKTAPLY